MNNNYFVVATAKHTLNFRGKQYKIGETVPTELTEKEYEFYKDALNVESATKVDDNSSDFIETMNEQEKPKDLEKELLKKKVAELEAKIAELEKPVDESEVKPAKRTYNKKAKKENEEDVL